MNGQLQSLKRWLVWGMFRYGLRSGPEATQARCGDFENWANVSQPWIDCCTKMQDMAVVIRQHVMTGRAACEGRVMS